MGVSPRQLGSLEYSLVHVDNFTLTQKAAKYVDMRFEFIIKSAKCRCVRDKKINF